MPRSKPQNTRRKLESAIKHIDKAVNYIYNILPLDVYVGEWDERYQTLLRMNIRLIGVRDYIESLLNPEKVGENEKQDNN